MPSTVLVGAQWGDEGKGKIIDLLAQRSDYVVRYQGGNNAGHTVRLGQRKFVLHLLPSGVLHKGKKCVIGNGVVIDPEALFAEIEILSKEGISVKGRLFVSEQAHIIFPYHKLIDHLREEFLQKGKIGTTKRGIGPCYSDKMARTGIRVCDLIDPEFLRPKLQSVLREKNEILHKIYGASPLPFEKVYAQYAQFGKKLKLYVTNTTRLLHRVLKEGKRVLFEGAQGTLLDVDHGTYPYVTSSNATVGGALVGSGVGPRSVNEVVGVVKAYTTRVGEGPFPTEFSPALMKRIQSRGEEFGATTGRPRRCGWFDAVVARYAAVVNDLDSLAVMKLDVLDDLATVKICTAYRWRGKILRDFPAQSEILKQCEPIYEEHAGWMSPTSKIRSFRKLPRAAQAYLNRISELLKVPIKIISVGSERTETIFVHGKFE